MRQLIWQFRSLMHNRMFLLAVFAVNVLGTLYGYVWYWDQLVDTYREHSLWMIVFVPDSPTASLWFTVSLGIVLFAPRAVHGGAAAWIAALGAVSSVKYGIWAVAMNAAVAYQGEPLVWEEWMLIASHTGMAVEVLLFIGLFRIRGVHLLGVMLLLFINDWLDYHVPIYPYLRKVLSDDLGTIELFTWLLTAASTVCVALVFRWSKRGQPPI